VGMGDCIAYLFNFSDGTYAGNESELLQSVKESAKLLEGQLKIKCNISASPAIYDVKDISRAYKQAQKAMEYVFVSANENIIRYQDIMDETINEYSFSFEEEKKLINCVKAGDFSGVEGVLDSVFRRMFSNRCLSLNLARCLYYDIISTAIKALMEISADIDGCFDRESVSIQELMDCKTIRDMQVKLRTIFQNICNYVSRNSEGNSSKMVRQIMVFVDYNFHDCNISIGFISDHFRMNAAYLGRLFKEHTGQSLLDYINRKRIEEVKGFLAEKKYNLGEIAGKVGFSNIGSLERVFRKIEGVTVTQFRMSLM